MARNNLHFALTSVAIKTMAVRAAALVTQPHPHAYVTPVDAPQERVGGTAIAVTRTNTTTLTAGRGKKFKFGVLAHMTQQINGCCHRARPMHDDFTGQRLADQGRLWPELANALQT